MFTLRQWSFAEKERRYTPHIHTYVRVCVLTSFCTIVFACLGYYLHLSSLCACVRDSLYARVCYICMCVCGRNCKQSEYKNWPLGWGNYFHFLCTLELSLSLPYSVLTFDPCSSNSTRSTSFISHYMVLYIYILCYSFVLFWFYLMLCHAYFQQPSLSRKRLRIWLKMLFKPLPPLDPTPLWAL